MTLFEIVKEATPHVWGYQNFVIYDIAMRSEVLIEAGAITYIDLKSNSTLQSAR